MHMLARVCFFHIGPEVCTGRSGKSNELNASGDMDFSILAGSFPRTGHWDIVRFENSAVAVAVANARAQMLHLMLWRERWWDVFWNAGRGIAKVPRKSSASALRP